MNLLQSIINFKNRYASPFEMASDGIMGMNQRNVNYIGRYNRRDLFPLVDNKLLTKKIAMSNNVKTPKLLGSIHNQHEVLDIFRIIGDHTEFCIKPAHGSGGKGILVIKDRSRNSGNFIKTSG
ncbi:MAG: sugar-transfer associated ATP-grasp domain-containing protein, partial [Succinivibrio sp.]